MTPERAQWLHKNASTIVEVLELMRSRKGRQNEVRFLESLEALARRDPMKVAGILRGLATEHEHAVKRYRVRYDEAVLNCDLDFEADALAQIKAHQAIVDCYLWAASALTRSVLKDRVSDEKQE